MAGHLLEKLRWDEHLTWWQGYLTFPSGRFVTVFVHQPDDQISAFPNLPETLDVVQAASRALLLWLQQHEQEFYLIVASEFLTAYNDNELDRDRISVEEFVARIRMTGITLFSYQTYDIHFSDGGMFGGHALICVFDENHQLTHTDMWG